MKTVSRAWRVPATAVDEVLPGQVGHIVTVRLSGGRTFKAGYVRGNLVGCWLKRAGEPERFYTWARVVELEDPVEGERVTR